MFDTYVTIVGNVLTAPEWRRTTNTGSLVANFKVASTARRLDRERGRWVDGNSLRVRVTCWRKLAEGVSSSLMTGDPVVVAGRLYTRDWTDADGNHRAMYELEAVAVGHDLSRGRGTFTRTRTALTTSAVEDDEADARVRDESSEAVRSGGAPALPADDPLAGPDGGFGDAAEPGDDGLGPLDADEPGDDPLRGPAGDDLGADPAGEELDAGQLGAGRPDDAADDPERVAGGAAGRRRRSRVAVPG
ncbi:MAG TPA: single-stranded DNA-binding protein [Pilimelia sp.]|nr:single-stranded DNA-binding protein [Pilimelia sp.]